MKKLILLILLATFASGYVNPIYYNGVQIKIYNGSTFADVKPLLDAIPSEYYKDLVYIRFKPRHYQKASGLYWWGQGIDMYNWKVSTLTHELAHHQQFLNGDLYLNSLNHLGNFTHFQHKIMEVK